MAIPARLTHIPLDLCRKVKVGQERGEAINRHLPKISPKGVEFRGGRGEGYEVLMTSSYTFSINILYPTTTQSIIAGLGSQIENKRCAG